MHLPHHFLKEIALSPLLGQVGTKIGCWGTSFHHEDEDNTHGVVEQQDRGLGPVLLGDVMERAAHLPGVK